MPEHTSQQSQSKQRLKVKVKAPVVQKRAGGEPVDNSDNSKKARSGAVFLGFVVLAYVIFLIITGQMSSFIEALSHVEMEGIMLASLAFVFYFIFGVIAYVIAVYLDHDSPVGIRDLMSVEASGIFFGNLTPMMAGAVPSQIYRLTRTGLDVGEASATQFTRFIIFQLAVVLFAALMLVAKLEYFFATYGDIIFLNLVVFAVHFIELAVLFAICLFPRMVQAIGRSCLRFASKHFHLKNTAHLAELIDVQVMDFHRAFQSAAKDLPSMALTLVVTMAQLACLYMIPYFVLQAFSIKADFIECLAAGSMVQMVASAVPLPGGTGGAEGGFLMFYGHLFGPASAAGFLVWRIITFFAPTFISAPLLGLRSNSDTPLYLRVKKWGAHLRRIYLRIRDGKSAVSSKNNNGVTLKGSALKQRQHKNNQHNKKN